MDTILPQRVIMDADPATGVPNRDIDDGLAILVMLASPEIRVEGITINFGNVGAEVGLGVARELLGLVRADVPLFKGAGTRTELGKTNPAVEYLIETARAFPGEISLLALAPLTNIATAILLAPDFAPNLKELVIMGGSLRFRPFSFFGEFNFHLDGQAASTVLAAPVRKTLLTMDVCSQAVFRRAHLRMIEERDSPVSRYLARVITPWLELNRKVFFRAQGFFPWDVVAAAYLIDRSLFDDNPCSFSVQKTGLCSGRLLEYRHLAPDPGVDRSGTINMPLTLDGERFMALFMNRLLKY